MMINQLSIVGGIRRSITRSTSMWLAAAMAMMGAIVAPAQTKPCATVTDAPYQYCQVDTKPILDSSARIRILGAMQLMHTNSATLHARFVLDARGFIAPSTVQILSTTSAEIAQAALQQIINMQFQPAQLHGANVPVALELKIVAGIGFYWEYASSLEPMLEFTNDGLLVSTLGLRVVSPSRCPYTYTKMVAHVGADGKSDEPLRPEGYIDPVIIHFNDVRAWNSNIVYVSALAEHGTMGIPHYCRVERVRGKWVGDCRQAAAQIH